jgi:hypothetical protein
MNDNEINDRRIISDFKSITFSNYKTTTVKTALLNSIINSRIEPACNWSVELICAGHYADLWDVILTYVGKHIHLGNPKLPIYIESRFNAFKDILHGGYIDNELAMRNNDKIRKIFAEIVCVLCNSRKKPGFENIKIKTAEEFDITQMTSRLKAPNITYANDIFLKDDPKELFIAINEFAYHISIESRNIMQACYWTEWLIEFEMLCVKRKSKTCCERRTFAPVKEKHQMDIIWIIWDAILNETHKRNHELCSKIMNAILNIFSIKYNNSSKKKRKYLIYFAISLLTEQVDYNVNIINDKKNIDFITSKINLIYKQLKKNEETPNTDYLFTGITSKSNLEKTLEKLEKMKEMQNVM